MNTASILDDLTRTLLYEGYSLFPYHRSAIKNQKPVPFGVVFPENYNNYNEHAHSMMHSQSIIKGNKNTKINIDVRFLHLKETNLLPDDSKAESGKDDYAPVNSLIIGGKSFRAGWQTIERKISSREMLLSQILKNKKVIDFSFGKMHESENINDEKNHLWGQQITGVEEINGRISIEAAQVENMPNAFRITVTVRNTTPIKNAAEITRDKVLSASFLSTHIILRTIDGEFISHQAPGDLWAEAIAGCNNINTWPILIDEDNTTLLSSPIILYDYPKLNHQNHGDLFDSTEIEEALLLHVSVLSDKEKEQIAGSDEKLNSMLHKVSQVTPEELIKFHGGMREID